MDGTSTALVGREHEREAIAELLAAVRSGAGRVLLVEGEPGIGKSRLLADVAGQAADCTLLAARASEYEADLPYALWAEALRGRLPDVAGADRHRVHGALRAELERMAGEDPLVLCLDDVHWADPASVEALAALLHRPPAAPVLLALAARTGRLPPVLTAALAAGRPARLALAPLSAEEARALVGAEADAVYADSGGNPFYLEQLARAGPGRGAASARAAVAAEGDGVVPAAVRAALAAELVALPDAARRLLDGAAVTGDPFEVGLAAEVAELDEAAALGALDVLLAQGLVRSAGAPRRFAFRHPVVRHAVYEAAPGGWRIAAHARAARALERAGSGPVQRCHHVEQAAQPGDEDALAVLEAAAGALQPLAPSTAARYYAAVLRLLPDAPQSRRTAIELRLADAQAAAGDAPAARATLLAALGTAPPEDRLRVTVGVANMEWWMGRVDDAARRLHVALGALPAEPSPDRVRLRLALALTALMRGDPAESARQAADARDDSRAIGDPVFEAAALACRALATIEADEAPRGEETIDAAAAALERLSREQLATRLPAFWMLGRARRALGQLAAALADLERGIALAAETGRENIRLQLTIEAATTLIGLGRLEEAIAAAEQGVEMARLASNPRVLLWAHCTLAAARLATGDVGAAVHHATEAAATEVEPDFHAAGQPGWVLGAALTAAGNADRGVAAMLASFGGAALSAVLPAERPLAAADLALAQLAAGDAAGAERTLDAAEAAAARSGRRSPPATGDDARRPPQAAIGLARSALLLGRGAASEALAAAREALEAARGAPLIAARARLAEGRALAAAGRRTEAKNALIAAESAFDGFGAGRLRDEAARELRRLGHRVRRPAREPADGPLTGREREIAELVAEGRTNREIAEQLVLSTRTIEAHLRSVFAKLGVRSRVELTRRWG